ncbi:PAS domain-containing protein [Maritimibacter sp. DP1N21-5]|uniref:PAS domain-containing protein n=1 Tax=Maritimibacter sp. DP1N21-5 TaxID=2836867 RepID=UPI001C443935|nr:PAS domain-containing protein [Maritimibacter sp. DP1N21-5]MBV7409928.1 PAS domain-containing protein [Maritimibacter sp. DP1N21-5]
MKIEITDASNVIPLAERRTEAQFPSIRRIESYWEGLRDGRMMPARAEIDPRGIADVLEFAFVLEKVAPGIARIRLAGMHLNDLMGMEVRGMPITAMFLPEARRGLQHVLESVLESPAAAALRLESDSGFTRPRLDAQMILLPIKDEQGRPTRILGALQAKGTIGRGPRRFRVLSQTVTPVSGCEERDDRPGDPRPVSQIQPSATSERKPHVLRLVHDADGL